MLLHIDNTTGKVCIPIDPLNVDFFDPVTSITVSDLYSFVQKNTEQNPLDSALKLFDDFLRGCEASRRKQLSVQRATNEKSLLF